MSVKIPSGFAEAAIIHTGSFGTAPFVCTFGIAVETEGAPFVNYANRCYHAWVLTFADQISTGITVEKCSLTLPIDGGGTGSVDSALASNAGTREGANENISACALVNKKTSQLGRQGRGRMFLPGMLDTGDTGLGGDYSNDFKTTMADLLPEFLVQLGLVADEDEEPCQMFLLHSTDLDPTPVTSLELAPLIGVLKRRLR